MKPQWKTLSGSISKFNDLFYQLVEGLTDKRMQKAFKVVADEWNKIVTYHNEFDKLVEPIAPIDVKLPFPSTEFSETWKLYKDYLLEDHQKYMGSRRESIMLKRLKSLSEKNEKRAIEMLEYFIATGWKTMYKVTDRQITGDDPAKVEEPQQTEIIIDKKVSAI
ncbi:hypothetical protein [Dysgonomonas sp. HGC4]|uniref:hypothetical protein n=1 Tax=Dysgonomonas sp. HGC4 TaxID=1658009 RepID=UPI0006837056|nr:hypothetical protein [Dysgonomonas sp. HGC4]MBD8349382.1 hypothetical protein [Dysgonomonas sp. HGC4]